jgi:hypothetical protein
MCVVSKVGDVLANGLISTSRRERVEGVA